MRVVGHRGAAGWLPENTLLGFAAAIDLGVDAIECDCHGTRDGHIVVIHDETVDRTTNGTGAVADLSLAELRALNAGHGEPIPTLDEVLSLIDGRCRLYCEIKVSSIAQDALRLVRKRGLSTDVLFISFLPDVLKTIRKNAPTQAVSALLASPAEDSLDWAVKQKMNGVQVDYTRASLHLLDYAKRAGLDFAVWTPRDHRAFDTMRAMGVDSITTDRPDLLLAHLQEAALKTESPTASPLVTVGQTAGLESALATS